MKRFCENALSFVLAVLLVGWVSVAAFADVVLTSQEFRLGNGGKYKVVSAAVTADITSGSTGVGTAQVSGMRGRLLKVVSYPLTSGAWPLSGYDCQFKESRGADVMGGSVMDRVNTSAQQAIPWTFGSTFVVAPVVIGTLEVNCFNIGTAKGIGLDMYFEDP